MAVQGEEREKPAAAAGGVGAGRRRGHPLLRGGWKRERYTHKMHPAQMEALRAMCGALIPSLPADVEGHGRGDPPGGKDLARFYQASAADSIVPDEVTRLVLSLFVTGLSLINLLGLVALFVSVVGQIDQIVST
jgi:long-chain-alcohol oxidase